MRAGTGTSWVLASVLALALTGCCDEDTPLGVMEGGVDGPVVLPLGTTDDFGVLAGTSVTSTGNTTISCDLGVSPGNTVSGFPPGTVGGTIESGNATSAQAQTDLTAAFNNAVGRIVDVDLTGDLVGGTMLAPGVYEFDGSLNVSGPVTLNALGDSTAVFIIRVDGNLTTAADSRILLVNGAEASNVFWVVDGTATLGANSEFAGTLIADQAITVNSGADVEGRLLSRTGSVTLNAATITCP